MAAGTFRGCFKRHARLRKVFADGENVSQVCGDFLKGAKGMHACGNFFRKAKCCSTFPGESRGTGMIDNDRCALWDWDA